MEKGHHTLTVEHHKRRYKPEKTTTPQLSLFLAQLTWELELNRTPTAALSASRHICCINVVWPDTVLMRAGQHDHLTAMRFPEHFRYRLHNCAASCEERLEADGQRNMPPERCRLRRLRHGSERSSGRTVKIIRRHQLGECVCV